VRRTDEVRSSNAADAPAVELRQRGHDVEVTVGGSRFRLDLAVKRRYGSGYALGVFIDSGAQSKTSVQKRVVK
jgi:hypothetical protein